MAIEDEDFFFFFAVCNEYSFPYANKVNHVVYACGSYDAVLFLKVHRV